MPGDVRNFQHPAAAHRQAVGIVGGTTPGAGGAGTSVVTRVNATIVNITIKAVNTSRIGLSIENNAVTNLFLKLGSIASLVAGAESFTVKLVPDAYYEVPFGYTGVVDGIWDSGDLAGEALVTELTA